MEGCVGNFLMAGTGLGLIKTRLTTVPKYRSYSFIVAESMAQIVFQPSVLPKVYIPADANNEINRFSNQI